MGLIFTITFRCDICGFVESRSDGENSDGFYADILAKPEDIDGWVYEQFVNEFEPLENMRLVCPKCIAKRERPYVIHNT